MFLISYDEQNLHVGIKNESKQTNKTAREDTETTWRS